MLYIDIFFNFSGTEETRNRSLSLAMAKENRNPRTHKSSLSFNDMDPKTIAEQLTYLEYRSLKKIPVTMQVHSGRSPWLGSSKPIRVIQDF